MPEIIGRSYEVSGDGFVFTAEVMSKQQDIHYTLYDGEQTFHKILKSPVCYFQEYGVTVAFDVDRGYD